MSVYDRKISITYDECILLGAFRLHPDLLHDFDGIKKEYFSGEFPYLCYTEMLSGNINWDETLHAEKRLINTEEYLLINDNFGELAFRLTKENALVSKYNIINNYNNIYIYNKILNTLQHYEKSFRHTSDLTECLYSIKDIATGLHTADTRPLKHRIEEWAMATTGVFSATEVDKELNIATQSDKKNRSKILERLQKENKIRAITGRHGMYEKLSMDLNVLDWENANSVEYPMKLPLMLNRVCRFMESQIMVVAGESNAGKTELLMQIAKMNISDKLVRYYTCEMDSAEFKLRADRIGLKNHKNLLVAYETKDYDRKINPNALNIIDYIDPGEKAYNISDILDNIHTKMIGGNGFCVISIQKNPDKDFGRGGYGSMFKPKLYISMKPTEMMKGEIKIMKLKFPSHEVMEKRLNMLYATCLYEIKANEGMTCLEWKDAKGNILLEQRPEWTEE